MGEMIELKRPDGQRLPGYSVGDRGPGVVVLQEWWGLNEQIKKVADRLAEAGFRAVVPDLFRGELAANAQEATHLMDQLNFGDACSQDVRAALGYLRKDGKKVAVLGFCMGGALTILSATKLPELDAAVCFYGIPPTSLADPATIRVPLLAHFANQDYWCTPEAIDGLESALKAGHVIYELYRYEAQHAFCNEARPEVYAPEAATLAWERSLAFLRRHL